MSSSTFFGYTATKIVLKQEKNIIPPSHASHDLDGGVRRSS